MAEYKSPVETQNPTGIVLKVQNLYEEMKLAWGPFRERALRAFEYVIGNQIDEEVRSELQAERRPALVFNLMQNKVVTIAGMLEANATYMRAIPVREGDEQLSDIHTVVVSDWAMPNCNGNREMGKAGIDASICGLGWTNNFWTTRSNPEGQWVTESVDPFMVMFDPNARKADQSDWRYLVYSAFYTAEEILGIYGPRLTYDQKKTIKERDKMIQNFMEDKKKPLGWVDRLWSGFSDAWDSIRGTTKDGGTDYEKGLINDFVDARTGRYRVIELHDRRTKVIDRLYNPATRKSLEIEEIDGETDEAREARIQKELKTLQQASVIQAQAQSMVTGGQPQEANGGQFFRDCFSREELWITAVVPTLLPDNPLLEQPYPKHRNGFAIKPVFGYDFHPDITKIQSLIQVLMDPQDSYNQRRMTTLELLMDAVNPDVEYPVGSIKPTEEALWKSKERGILKPYSVVQGAKPEMQHPLAEAIVGLKGFAEEDRGLSEQLTAITPNAQGLEESAGESGVLFAQRVQRSMQALAYFFGNLQFHQQEVFKYCDTMLQVFLTMPRKIRILDKTNQPNWLPLNMPTILGTMNDFTQGEYDFIPDSKTLGETAKQIKFAEAVSFIKIIPPELVMWPKLFELWDSPVADEMGQYAQAMLGMQVQAQQRAAVLEQAGKTVEVAANMEGAAVPQERKAETGKGSAKK